MSPNKRLRLSTRRCVWFCSIVPLTGSKAQPPLSHSFSLSQTNILEGEQTGQVKYDTLHTQNKHSAGIYS